MCWCAEQRMSPHSESWGQNQSIGTRRVKLWISPGPLAGKTLYAPPLELLPDGSISTVCVGTTSPWSTPCSTLQQYAGAGGGHARESATSPVPAPGQQAAPQACGAPLQGCPRPFAAVHSHLYVTTNFTKKVRRGPSLEAGQSVQQKTVSFRPGWSGWHQHSMHFLTSFSSTPSSEIRWTWVVSALHGGARRGRGVMAVQRAGC
jgi:hypothetical protein